MPKLTDKQEEKYRIFAKEYIIDFNGTRAATAAGYSEKTAHVQSTRMLNNVKVQEFIKEEIDKRSERLDITQDMVIKEIASSAFFDIGELFNGYILKEVDQLPEKTRRAISGIKVREEKGQAGEVIAELKEFRTNDKLKALELLGKHLGMFKDKVDLTTTTSGEITIQIVEDKDDKTT